MLAAMAAVLQARLRAANKLSPGEIASLLSGGWCVGVHYGGVCTCACAVLCLHRVRDRNLWRILAAEAQEKGSVSKRYDYNNRKKMKTAENILYYLPRCLSIIPHCSPVYTVFGSST